MILNIPGGCAEVICKYGKESACQGRRHIFHPWLGKIPSLEEEMATRSSLLAWRIPWIEEPGGLQSVGVAKSWRRLSTQAHTLCHFIYSTWTSADFVYPRGGSWIQLSYSPPVRWFGVRYSVLSGSYPTLCQAPLSMGILQARILEWVAKPSSRSSSQRGGRTEVSGIAGRFFTSGPPGVWRDHPILQNTNRMNGMNPCSKTSLSFLRSQKAACRILVPGPPAPPTAAAPHIKHWTENFLNVLLNII